MALSFRLFKIPITIHFHFLIIVVLLSISRLQYPLFLVSWIAVVTISIILHELGHALAARFFGGTPTIELRGLGGLTYLSGKEKGLHQDIIIPLAGPAVGIIIGLVFFWIESHFTLNNQLIAVIVADCIFINLFWGMANLLPILPLDGGHISMAVFSRILKSGGRTAAYILSLIVAVPLIILVFFYKQYYVLFLLAYFAIFNIQSLHSHVKRGDDTSHNTALKTIHGHIQNKEFDIAIQQINSLLGETENEHLKRDLIHLSSWAYFYKEDYKKVQEFQFSLSNPKNIDKRLMALTCYQSGEFEKARDYFREIMYHTHDKYITEYYLSCLLKLGDWEEGYTLVSHYMHSELSSESLHNLGIELINKKEFDKAFHVCSLVFSREKNSMAAYNAACALSCDNKLQKSLQWLKKAVKNGFSDTALMLKDPDLSIVRELPEFSEIVESIQKLQ